VDSGQTGKSAADNNDMRTHPAPGGERSEPGIALSLGIADKVIEGWGCGRAFLLYRPGVAGAFSGPSDLGG